MLKEVATRAICVDCLEKRDRPWSAKHHLAHEGLCNRNKASADGKHDVRSGR